jgi:hypothetical protein
MKSELRALQAEGTLKSKNYPYITFLPHFIEFMQLSLRLLLFAILLIYSTHSFLFYISNFHIHQNISILHESLISFIDRSGFSTCCINRISLGSPHPKLCISKKVFDIKL